MSRQTTIEIQVRRDRALIPSGSEELRVECSTWYGNVPSDWNVDRFKRIATIRNGQVDPEDDRYKDLPLFAPNHIESGTGRLLEVESADAQGAESGKFLVEPGEVVYSKIRPELRKVIVAPCKGLCSADMYPVHPGHRIESRFLYYEMLSDGFSQYTVLESDRVAMPKINRKSLGECIFLYPDRKQQARICEYLDFSCTALDAAVAAKRRQLKTLDALRSSVISHAVTHGLAPSTKMRASGVSWFGNIPEHWQDGHLKRYARRIQTGVTPPTDTPEYYEDGSIPWFAPGSFESQIELTEPRKLINERALSEGVLRIFPAGSVFVIGIGATIGKVGIIAEQASCNQQIIGIVCDHRMNPRFLAYQLKIYEVVIPGICVATTLPIFNQVQVGYLPVIVPPVSEQQAICDYIDSKLMELKKVVDVLETQIATLTAYRKSLIHECVTGQRRISEADVNRVKHG